MKLDRKKHTTSRPCAIFILLSHAAPCRLHDIHARNVTHKTNTALKKPKTVTRQNRFTCFVTCNLNRRINSNIIVGYCEATSLMREEFGISPFPRPYINSIVSRITLHFTPKPWNKQSTVQPVAWKCTASS